jgi:hypothetical protein
MLAKRAAADLFIAAKYTLFLLSVVGAERSEINISPGGSSGVAFTRDLIL